MTFICDLVIAKVYSTESQYLSVQTINNDWFVATEIHKNLVHE